MRRIAPTVLVFALSVPAVVAALMVAAPAEALPSAISPRTAVSPRTTGDGVLGSWSALGGGLPDHKVFALVKRGSTLYAGGEFTSAGGKPGTAYVAAWSSVDDTWRSVGGGTDGTVRALAITDDTVIAAGTFTAAGGKSTASRVAAWSSQDDTWSAFGVGATAAEVLTLAATSDGRVYAGGTFTSPVAGALYALRDDTWTAVAGPYSYNRVDALALRGSATMTSGDDTLFVGGPFNASPGAFIAALKPAASWASLGLGLSADVASLAVLSDDTLFVGGDFSDAGGDVSADRIAAWNGSAWSALGTGVNLRPWAIATDDSRGLVYAGGAFTQTNGGAANSLQHVGVWDTRIAEWIPLQFGAAATNNGVTSGDVLSFAVDDSVVYVGGSFLDAGGDPLADRIARWTWDPPTGTVDDTALPGDTVTIHGSGLIGVTSVSFGSVRTGDDTPAIFTRDDSTTIQVTVPAGDFHDDTIYVNGVGGIGEIGPFTSWPTFPDAPQTPSAEAGINSATAEWDPPASDGGDTVTTYVATASPGGASCTAATTTCTVSGLTAGTPYTIRVRAINAKGASSESIDSNAVVPFDLPPSPRAPGQPTSVAATAGDAKASVTWLAPSSTGSFPISTYQVESTPGSRTCITAERTCEITGLTNGTDYTFAVRALNGSGWSNWSDPSNTVTPRATATPSITISGSRSGRLVRITGSSIGIAPESVLVPWTRVAGAQGFTRGRRTAATSDSGAFTWQRRANRQISVFFSYENVRSNTVTIR